MALAPAQVTGQGEVDGVSHGQARRDDPPIRLECQRGRRIEPPREVRGDTPARAEGLVQVPIAREPDEPEVGRRRREGPARHQDAPILLDGDGLGPI